MTEHEARQDLPAYGRSLFARGYSCGTSGNLSARLDDGTLLVTPTNVSLGNLQPDQLSHLSADGAHLDGPPPTKEAWLHLAMYATRQQDAAVVHLHSTYAVALSCRTDRPPDDALPSLTPYVVMRVGRVATVPYGRPGDGTLATTVRDLARHTHSLLLANHGPVVSGVSIGAAAAIAEELEETARLFFLLEGRPHRCLTASEIAELGRVFGR
jgi:ribulose-5-phosphate 4-epimerase/fuculose-1-phosphate aldolase